MKKHELNRRKFIHTLSLAYLSFATIGCGKDNSQIKNKKNKNNVNTYTYNDPALPDLGGAPNTDDGKTVAAFVDTIIPGSHRDPENHPGALDVKSAFLFFDDTIPQVKQFVPVLTFFLHSISSKIHGIKKFHALKPSQRDEVLEYCETNYEQFEFAITLAKLAYFSRKETADLLGYPGANDGYLNDYRISFKRPLAKEITKDGNFI